MGSNRFGNIFSITTWGESHGPAIGAVIDGCPAGLNLSEEDIEAELSFRRPGQLYTSPRKEPDQPHILSGVFEGKTTGAPISIIIYNQDVDSSKYEPIKDLLRPSHANFTYLEKYGLFDYRGGGRASARETACRVAAGAVAKKLLKHFGIQQVAYIKAIGEIYVEKGYATFDDLILAVRESVLFCPDPAATIEMMRQLDAAIQEGDSLGGIVEWQCHFLPVGLGDPVYEKLEANLAKAMMSLPAAKGFEIGKGFQAAAMKGSAHNDLFVLNEHGKIQTQTNHAGGTLGGISTGMPLCCRVAFKPTSTIRKTQLTLSTEKKYEKLELPEGSRHDPCVAIRAVPAIEAMGALIIADALLMHRHARL